MFRLDTVAGDVPYGIFCLNCKRNQPDILFNKFRACFMSLKFNFSPRINTFQQHWVFAELGRFFSSQCSIFMHEVSALQRSPYYCPSLRLGKVFNTHYYLIFQNDTFKME